MRLGVLLVLLAVVLPGAPVALAAAGTPAAPAPATFASLAVDIWPEHDDPRLLVIYRGTLSAGVAIPHTLTFAIPPTAQVNAAAYRTDDGQLLSSPHQYRLEGDRLLVSFSVPARGFQFEYYVDSITGRPQRSFVAEVVLPYAVLDLRASVEQPLRSSGFALNPAAGGTALSASGLTHHLYTLGRWPAGKAWRVRATYTKEDPNPSLARTVRPPEPAQPPASAPPRQVPGWVRPAVAALALVLAGLALGLFLGSRLRGGATPTGGQGGGPARKRGPGGRSTSARGRR